MDERPPGPDRYKPVHPSTVSYWRGVVKRCVLASKGEVAVSLTHKSVKLGIQFRL